MRNADMPANPTNLDVSEYAGTINCPYNKPMTGITKREAFAMAAMQGYLSSEMGHVTSAEEISCWSVQHADALLNELSKGEL